MPGLQAISDLEDEGDNKREPYGFKDIPADPEEDMDEYEVIGLDNEAYTRTFMANKILKGTNTSLGSEHVNIDLAAICLVIATAL